MNIEIRPPQPGELAEVADVLGMAFATQPSSLAIYKGKPDTGRAIGLVFGAMLENLPGQILVTKLDNRTVGAMWIIQWPGCRVKPRQILKMLPTMAKSGKSAHSCAG